jgi:hypothetical protein
MAKKEIINDFGFWSRNQNPESGIIRITLPV